MVVLTESLHHTISTPTSLGCKCRKTLSVFYFLIYAGQAWVSQYTISFFISFQLVHNGSLIQQERKRGRRSVREERLGRCGDGDGNNEITQCWWTTLHYLHYTALDYTHINIIIDSVLEMSVRLPREFWNHRRSQWWGLFVSVYHSEPAVLFVQTKTPGMSGLRITKRPRKFCWELQTAGQDLEWILNSRDQHQHQASTSTWIIKQQQHQLQLPMSTPGWRAIVRE